MMNNWTRKATAKEMAIYNKANDIILDINDDEADELIETIGNYVFSFSNERKTNYNKLYRLAKKYNLTVKECELWYCID